VDRELKLPGLPVARRSLRREDDYDPVRAGLGRAPLPESVDLREPWHPVVDQGRTASCVGWTIADSIVRWHLVREGRLEPAKRLSARHVWMAAKEFDQRADYPSTFLELDGTSLKAGLDVVRKFGAVTEEALPWEGGLAGGDPDAFYASAHKIGAYFNLGDDAVPDRARFFGGWRRWLFEHGPIAVLIKVDKNIEHAGPELDGFDEASVAGSHCAALFGYGPDHFLLRSSWGAGWGESGYARMSLSYTAAAVIESYGVTV
jgi:hypothetical protein